MPDFGHGHAHFDVWMLVNTRFSRIVPVSSLLHIFDWSYWKLENQDKLNFRSIRTTVDCSATTALHWVQPIKNLVEGRALYALWNYLQGFFFNFDMAILKSVRGLCKNNINMSFHFMKLRLVMARSLVPGRIPTNPYFNGTETDRSPDKYRPGHH